MRLSLFLYTNKEKKPFPSIALFLTPNVVCEKHHDVILDKICLSVNPSVLIMKTTCLSRSSTMFKVSFTYNWGRNYSNYVESTEKKQDWTCVSCTLIFLLIKFTDN